jgi:hypothetical protein
MLRNMNGKNSAGEEKKKVGCHGQGQVEGEERKERGGKGSSCLFVLHWWRTMTLREPLQIRKARSNCGTD